MMYERYACATYKRVKKNKKGGLQTMSMSAPWVKHGAKNVKSRK